MAVARCAAEDQCGHEDQCAVTGQKQRRPVRGQPRYPERPGAFGLRASGLAGAGTAGHADQAGTGAGVTGAGATFGDGR
ncbi:hypothetical protein Xind_03951 [Xenorhabdus indica]|nr:hypothetical protein [Xenorhabdus indica]